MQVPEERYRRETLTVCIGMCSEGLALGGPGRPLILPSCTGIVMCSLSEGRRGICTVE